MRSYEPILLTLFRTDDDNDDLFKYKKSTFDYVEGSAIPLTEVSGIAKG